MKEAGPRLAAPFAPDPAACPWNQSPMLHFDVTPGRDLVPDHAPMIRAFLTVASCIEAEGAIGLTRPRLRPVSSRRRLRAICTAMCLPGWTALLVV